MGVVSCCCVCLLGHRMENFHCDWGDKGGNAGACWECWKCEPCCGEPCGVVPAIKCILCFWCCNPCSMGKLFSHTLEQDCAVVNHCLYAFFCGPCSGCQELRSVSVDTWNWWEGFALNPMDS